VLRGEELARHYASADLFAFPSLSETFGNVTLEAMASGLAVVAFDYGATREHLCDGAHGAAVALGNEPAFVTAMVDVGANGSLFRMGKAACTAIQHLHPDEVARDFADLLAELGRTRQAA
jgi:glycosyltransferase involved in cell wall biosynthesis